VGTLTGISCRNDTVILSETASYFSTVHKAVNFVNCII